MLTAVRLRRGRARARPSSSTCTGSARVVTKSIMLEPRSGRPTPRMAETPSGMLNSIGLQGPASTRSSSATCPGSPQRGVRAVVSIAGGSVDEYAKLARRLRGAPGVTAVEVNISCPNVEDRGPGLRLRPGSAAAAVIAAVRATAPSTCPVFAKLSPDVTDIVALARAVRRRRAPTGCRMINTPLGMVIDTDDDAARRSPASPAGCPGPAIRPLAVRCVWQVHAALPGRADHRHGRRPHRRGRARVHPRRRLRRRGRHRASSTTRPRRLRIAARAAQTRSPRAASTASPTRSAWRHRPAGQRRGRRAPADVDDRGEHRRDARTHRGRARRPRPRDRRRLGRGWWRRTSAP